MTLTPVLGLIINKDGSTIGASETFLRAHLDRLPFRTLGIIGNPGSRRTDGGTGPFLLSRSLVPRGARWLMHHGGLRASAETDRRSLASHFRAREVDVVMAEYGPTALSVVDACGDCGIPLVTHFHGWDAYVLAANPASAAKYRSLFDRSEAIVAVSRHMREHLIRLGAPAERVVWNPCGAEPAPHPADPAAAPPVFLSVGRATPKKALVVALLAFARVRESVPAARLELVGGHADAHTEQLVLALGIHDAVTFHGPRSHTEVLALMQRARCYVHPSVTAPDGDMEGTPVSVLEAMAAGIPVVSSRHGGILDVLGGTAAGDLLDEYDVAGTAQAMLRYASDPQGAAQAGAEGRRLLDQHWSMERSLGALGRIIDVARQRDRTALALLAAQVEQPPSHEPIS